MNTVEIARNLCKLPFLLKCSNTQLGAGKKFKTPAGATHPLPNCLAPLFIPTKYTKESNNLLEFMLLIYFNSISTSPFHGPEQPLDMAKGLDDGHWA